MKRLTSSIESNPSGRGGDDVLGRDVLREVDHPVRPGPEQRWVRGDAAARGSRDEAPRRPGWRLPVRSPVRVRSAPRARPSPASPPVASTVGWARPPGRNRLATVENAGRSPARFSSVVGAVHPTAVTRRSQSIRSPLPGSRSARDGARLAHHLGAHHVAPIRASTTRTTSTPARRRSSTAASPSALAVRTTARSPGRTAHRLINAGPPSTAARRARRCPRTRTDAR